MQLWPFRKPHFWLRNEIFKNTILTHCDTICVSKSAQKRTIAQSGDPSWQQKISLEPVFNFIAWTSF